MELIKMSRSFRHFLFLLASLHFCSGDVYMHNPRGSNNRLNEQSANRKNGNRLFDSQNNNRGGYNVGDKTDRPAGGNENNQYQMKYFQSGSDPSSDPSELVVTWTNQHGCGANQLDNPNKLNCEIVLQFMVTDDENGVDNVKDGTSTGNLQYTEGNRNENAQQTRNNKQNNVRQNSDKGLHESWDNYDQCRKRDANLGLFMADQNRKQNRATNTRQNPNANRRGFECAEERDYYPYWHPSPWIDVAVLTSNVSLCNYYQKESGNVKPRGQCFETNKLNSKYNNAADCRRVGGKWKDVHQYLEKDTSATSLDDCKKNGRNRVWATPRDATDPEKEECLVQAPKVICQEAPFTRANHLGNTPDAAPAHFTWTLPNFPSGKTKKGIYRIRYNISTDDYEPFNTDSSKNGRNNSPVKNNPEVDVGTTQKLKLAINTAQFGRTFQDRSHVFQLEPRPEATPSGSRIVNLNVKGKRGNIVQCYPAVEYDFVPNDLTISSSDLVHLQWTGSNTHHNGSPQGDGQQGDDGQGNRGTDRSNFVEIPDDLANFPLAYVASKLLKNAKVVWNSAGVSNMDSKDLAVFLASSGYYESAEDTKQKLPKMNPLLNNAPASFQGVLLSFKKSGTFAYMSTRNNNFSNRSQKGKITVL